MRLLLADDHRIVREGLRWMLSGEPDIEIVGEVGDGGQLFDALDRDRVDVVLLDLRMPGLSGLEVLQRLTRCERSTPGPAVVILSMHEEPSVVRRAIELGAAGYLLKSSTRDQLLTALRHVAAGHCYVQAEVTGPLLDQVAGRRPPETVPTLTERELDVLELVAAGHANKQIAARLGLSEDTVKSHLKAAFAHLGARNRTEAVMTASRLELIGPGRGSPQAPMGPLGATRSGERHEPSRPRPGAGGPDPGPCLGQLDGRTMGSAEPQGAAEEVGP